MTLCLHAAAAKPTYTDKAELPEDLLKQAIEEGKAQAQDKLNDKMPEKAREKALAGIAAKAEEKLLKRDVLMEQELAVAEEPITVAAYLKEESKKLGKDIRIKQWTLFAIK